MSGATEALELLAEVQRCGVSVRLDGGRLRCIGPRSALTPELQAALAACKECLVELLGAAPARPPLARADVGGEAPPSFAQQRLWVLEQLTPGKSVHHMPAAFRLRGALDVLALERALSWVVERHGALRTTLIVRAGLPLQRVSPEARCALPVIDLSTLSADRRLDEAHAIAANRAREPFTLDEGQAWRASLLRLDVDDHVLLFTAHHIVFDAWSSGILWRELTAHYSAILAGADRPLGPAPAQYTDYARWQHADSESGRLESARHYWTHRLAGAPVLDLPTDRPRRAGRSGQGAELSVRIDPDLAAALRACCRERRVTPFMPLLSGFLAVLQAYTGQDDLVVGTPVAGRTLSGTESIIGLLVNTLPLRVDISGDPSFADLINRVRESLIDALAHEELPFDMLVAELNPHRDLARTPVFQVMFALQNASTDDLELPGVIVESWDIPSETARFDLMLLVRESTRGWQLELEYDRDLFDGATMRGLVRHYLMVLAGAFATPERRLSELGLLDLTEAREIRRASEGVPLGEPGVSMPERFAVQVRRQPDAVALVHQGEHWSYQHLDRNANRLARRLRAAGIGRETRVALVLGRSPRLVSAMLGVLKAGAAYVPIDPAYPSARQQAMLDAARPDVVLAEAGVCIGKSGLARAITIEALEVEALHETDAAPAVTIEPSQLAYVITTSGSTGRPKAIGVTHGNVGALCRWAEQAFPSGADAVVLAATSVCFDLSVFEILVTLARGGTVILVPSALHLADCPDRHQVGLVNSVPSAVAQLVDHHWLPQSVRMVNLAGESLPRALVRRLQRNRALTVANLYGPSETTVYSTHWVAPAASDCEPTIGRPIRGTRLQVLDAAGRLAPLGIPGELHIAGSGVARGYLGQPALTAERFLPDAYGPEPGARLYRTGDLARLRADGEFEFLGRIDRQIKLRGFRIELAELETALGEHELVAGAVATYCPSDDGGRLDVFYESSPAAAVSPQDLRRFLKGRLPDYMIPSRLVPVPSLPRLPNGKLDHRAVAALTVAAPSPRAPPAVHQASSRTPTEAVVAEALEELLRTAAIGLDDDFFALGGHSLHAAQLAGRLRETFQVELPLRVVFERPTIRGLSEFIEQAAPRRAREEVCL